MSAMLAGLVGVHVATVLGFWFGGWFGDFELVRLDYNTGNGAVEMPAATPTVQFLVGGLSHYLDGVFFGVIFAIACPRSSQSERHSSAMWRRPSSSARSSGCSPCS